MENIILDIETDGLLDTCTKVHCLVMKVESTNHIEVATTDLEIQKAVHKFRTSHIIGHNIL